MAGMRVTLGQLQAFAAVAKLGSFSAAAKALFVTQPAISKKIHLLEEEIGLPVFEQIGKKLYLTEAGKELLNVCAEWLKNWEYFEQKVADFKGLKQGRLSIAVVTTSKYFMPRILGPFYALYPGIEMAMEVINRDRLIARLAANQDDLYIMGMPPQDREIIAEPLMANPLIIIAHSDHPLAKAKTIPLQTLATLPFIMREKGSGTRTAVEKHFQEHQLTVPIIKLELGSNEAIKQAVAGGLGISVLSRHTLGQHLALEGVAELKVEHFPIMRHWYVVYPKGKSLSIVAETFLQFLKDNVALLKK